MHLTGRTYKDLICKTVIDAFPNQSTTRHLHQLDMEVIHGKREVDGTFFFHNDKGDDLAFPCKRICFFHTDGQPAGMIGIIQMSTNNASLNDALAKSLRLIEIISRFQKVVSKSLDIDTTVQEAIAFLQPVLDVDTCIVFLAQDSSLTLKGVYPKSSMIDGWKQDISKIKRCLCKLSIKEKKIQFISNLQEIDYLKNSPCTRAGFHSLCSVPLITDDKVYGILALATKKERDFSTDLQLLEIIGGILSIAVKNALLYNDIKQATMRYKIVADHTKNFEFWLSPDDSFLYVSPAAQEITGFVPQEFYKDASLLKRIILREDKKLWQEAVEGQGVDTFNVRIRTKSGDTRWIEATVYKIFAEDGTFLGIRGSISDATQKFESKMAEKKSQILLTSIFNGINDPMFMIDEKYRIQMINKSALDYFNVTNDDIIGEKCYQVFAQKGEPCEKCASLLNSDTPLTDFEKTIVRDDRECVIKVFLHRVRDDDHNISGTLVHVKDITKEKIIERELINTEKLSMLGVLSASMAHEINHPNNLILFNIPILREYITALLDIIQQQNGHKALQSKILFGFTYDQFIEDLFRLLGNIEEGGLRIKEIVDRLQLFIKPADYKKKEKIDLRKVIDHALKMCATQLKTKIKEIDIKVECDIRNIYLNPFCLEHVLVNLILNAAQAMDKPDSYLGIHCIKGRAWDESLIIEVKDNGQGIDSSEIKKIFMPFYSRRSGTGLGLFISKNLIDSLGGTIEVESEPGIGSTFRIKLPI